MSIVGVIAVIIALVAVVLCLVTSSWYSGLEKRINELEKHYGIRR